MRTFGLIGYPLTHSFSKKYFSEKFLQQGLMDCSYENFSIEKIELLQDIFGEHPSLVGLNVTIPYKEKVLPYLDEMTDVVKQTGACNCIKIFNGLKIGYNTDVIGFGTSLDKHLNSNHKKALVLGTGGAAKAVKYALQQREIQFLEVSRNLKTDGVIAYKDIDADLLKEYTLIINTTPVGMYPNIEDAPELPYAYLTPEHYLFDLVYNPAKTKFLQLGEEKGAIIENGTDMLKIQADASWEIWNS